MNTKILSTCFLVVMTLSWTGCARDNGRAGQSVKIREEISYYDRNGDGKVDEEKHHYVGGADMDWELLDENYDGRYEKKIQYGFAVTQSSVDLPVAKNVRIEQKNKN